MKTYPICEELLSPENFRQDECPDTKYGSQQEKPDAADTPGPYLSDLCC